MREFYRIVQAGQHFSDRPRLYIDIEIRADNHSDAMTRFMRTDMFRSDPYVGTANGFTRVDPYGRHARLVDFSVSELNDSDSVVFYSVRVMSADDK